MSKVQLQGNASGTGIFTIASPNSNTDRTLTLPDDTGTLLSSGGTGIVTQAMLAANVAGQGPAFSAQRTTTTLVNNATWTQVALNVSNYDTNSNFNTSTYRFTPTVAGYYQMTASCNWAAGSGTTITTVRFNGGEYMRMGRIPLSSTDETNTLYSCLIPFNGSTDYAELWVYTSNATSMNFYNATMQGVLVRRT